jgi:hypothetical protein
MHSDKFDLVHILKLGVLNYPMREKKKKKKCPLFLTKFEKKPLSDHIKNLFLERERERGIKS